MRWAWSAGLAALAIGAGLAAQAQDRHLSDLFMSPMGEPFRSTDAATPAIDLWFAAADSDHDGKLSRAEFLSEAAAFYARLDANHDGYATSIESTALWQTESPEVFEPWFVPPAPTPDSDGSSRPARHAPDPTLAGPARFGLLPEREPVITCDANFDRRVTAEEFQACADRRFTQLDVNGDGFFAPDEVRWPGRQR